jgi:3D (Asp-Asp-Asp) domain-containing protein
MKKGSTKVVTKGSDGTANITYKISYRYGKEIKRTVLKTDYVTKPKTEVVRVGTKKTASAGGSTFTYSSKYSMVATAYCDGGNTASGPACGDGIIAVDPSVIPLGSKVYVVGYGYAIAADTGGFIKGNRIDLWMSNNSLCEQWGRRTVTMYVLD